MAPTFFGTGKPGLEEVRVRGSAVDATAILIGGGIGVAAGNRLPGGCQRIVTAGVGLSTLLIGMQMALKVQHTLPRGETGASAAGRGIERLDGRRRPAHPGYRFLLLDVERLPVAN
ncbi:MAG: DUF554 family protein, partial [Zetaproteobacteria bacterium]